MYIKKKYGFFVTVMWSIKPFILGFIYAMTVNIILYFLEISFSIPFQPISIIGIAVAFYLGFKNNSSYDRTWEARKIWGGIVNNSRSFGIAVVSFVQGKKEDEIKKELIYRHIAWITALRHQLRLSRPWEHTENRLNGLYAPTVCEDFTERLDMELMNYISEKEMKAVEDKSNIAIQIMKIQSKRLQELKDLGYFNDFKHADFHKIITYLYDEQGKAERIKNFPFPRQYASTAITLTLIFSALLPFGMLDVFKTFETWKFLLSPILTATVIWVFFLMEKIGDYSENPFEGTYNDVPITSIAVGIEIDLREMINDTNIPKPIEAVDGFLM